MPRIDAPGFSATWRTPSRARRSTSRSEPNHCTMRNLATSGREADAHAAERRRERVARPRIGSRNGSVCRHSTTPRIQSAAGIRDARGFKGDRARVATEVYAGRVEDYTEGRRAMVSINDRDVFVFERNGRFYAFENNCRHMGGPVGEGMLIGKVESILDENCAHVGDRFSTSEIHIVCPWHGWEYDIETGVCAADRRIRLRRYEAVARGEEVYVTF